MALFGKKTEPFPADMPRPSLGPPTDLVIGMRQQGFTNNQIVQTLQRDGYTSDQIFDAMSQADIKGGVQPIQLQYAEPYPPYPEMVQPGFQPMQGPALGAAYEEPSREKIEEVAEAIIEEKWSEIVTSVNKVVEWKNKTEAKLEAFEEKVDTLQKSFDEMHNAIIGKITESDKNILEVGTEIKAMQRVFKQVLPTFTQNVNQLSRIINRTQAQGTKTRVEEKRAEEKKK